MCKEFSKTLLKCLTVLFISMAAAQAGMLSTDEIVASASNQPASEISVAREQVKQTLIKHGVKSENIDQRLDQLTPQEMQQLASKFEELPAAGAGAVFLVSGAVSLMLEMTGVTDLTTTF